MRKAVAATVAYALCGSHRPQGAQRACADGGGQGVARPLPAGKWGLGVADGRVGGRGARGARPAAAGGALGSSRRREADDAGRATGAGAVGNRGSEAGSHAVVPPKRWRVAPLG